VVPRPIRVLVLLTALLAAGCTDESAKATDGPLAADETGPTIPAPESPSTAPEPASLLPNLRSLPAERVSIRRTRDGRELRFAGILANVGAGPMVVRPDNRSACKVGQRHASQVVYGDTNDNGVYDVRADGELHQLGSGCMLDHPTHKHWHFDAMARYALHQPSSDRPIEASDKVSFCLRDSRRAPPLETYPQRYRGCTRDSVQGISVGWADVYRPSLPGQELPLPDDLADGTFCLLTEADPDRLLRETNEDDNAAVVGVQITSAGASLVPVPAGCTLSELR
jgi:hypothetical protein